MKTFLPAATIVLTLYGLEPAAAHARLVRAQPAFGATVAAPHAVTIDFSEGVVPRFSGITVSDAAGKPVPTGKPGAGSNAKSLSVSIDQTLAPGSYSVKWHAVSIDSHRTQGSFTFKVAP